MWVGGGGGGGRVGGRKCAWLGRGPPRSKATCWQQSPTPTTCGDRDRLLPRSAARGPKKTSVATVVIFQLQIRLRAVGAAGRARGVCDVPVAWLAGSVSPPTGVADCFPIGGHVEKKQGLQRRVREGD